MQTTCTPMAVRFFNDDDVYVYDAATLRFVRCIPCHDRRACAAALAGQTIEQGHTARRGMLAKGLGLWR